MAEQIDEIIDDQIVSTRDGGYHRFWFVGKDYLLLITLELIERNSNSWTLIVWSIMRAKEVHIRQSRVFPNPGGMMGTSLQDCDSTPGGVTLFQFGLIRAREFKLHFFFLFIVIFIWLFLLVPYRLSWNISVDVGLFKAKTGIVIFSFGMN